MRFFNLHNIVPISGCNTYEMQGDNDFEITCSTVFFVNIGAMLHALRVTEE